MENKHKMKEKFAKALLHILETTPLEDVSIKEILEQSKLSKNTFYYYFDDKYELVDWIFELKMKENEEILTKALYLPNNFINVCNSLYDNRSFYLSCFSYFGHTKLYDSLFQIFFELWKSNLNMRKTRFQLRISEKEILMLAELKTYALIGVINNWMRNGMKEEDMEDFESMYKLLDRECFCPGPTAGYKLSESQLEESEWMQVYIS